MLLLLACTSAPSVILPPDATRSGQDGGRGPLGAALQALTYTARATETVAVDFVYPAEDDATPVAVDGGWPLVVFVHGGDVAPERYYWFAAHLASRGYAVALPYHPLDLAFFEAGNARVARAGVAEDYADSLSGTAAVAGHSLGGVVSVIDWVADPAFEAVFLAASYPDDGTDPTDRTGSPALSLVGSMDQYAAPADVKAGADRFDPAFFGVVQGMNHFDWTDGAEESELAADGASTSTDANRLNAMNVVDTFFDAALRADADAAARMDAGRFPNVETTL